jgi:uncharacterized protein
MNTKFGLAAALAALLISPALAQVPQPHTVTVSGYARILATPDHASIDIGVVTPAKTAELALQANNAEMARVVRDIRALGIPANDIQTTDFSLDAVHPKRSNGEDDDSRIAGYSVSNKVTVSVSDIALVPRIIDTGVSAGANSANSVTFDVKDSAKLDDQALAAAMRDARHRAEVAAGAEGLKAGGVVAISTVAFGAPSFAPPPEFVASRENAAPILPGQTEISAQVTVIYTIE